MKPTHTIAHLTDLHLRPSADPLIDGVDPRERLERALRVLTTWDWPVDAWLFTGDLSDTGDAETYATLRSLVETAAREAGVQVVWGNGNHDDLPTLRRVLLDAPEAGASQPLNQSTTVRGLRLITLDTCVEHEPAGLVSDASLAWLRGELARWARSGTILALHHPPLPPVQDAAAGWPLQNPDALASAIQDSDVRLLVGGHFHQTSFGTIAGKPVVGATSLVYTQDGTVGRTLRGQDTHTGFNLIQCYADQIVTTVVHLDAGQGVHPEVPPR